MSEPSTQKKKRFEEMRSATPPEPEPLKKWFAASPPDPGQKKPKEKTESRQ